ncbi:NAD-dependent epimerase/dehydratase family protein [Vibrio vulnificus]|uniref:NAD-dependent epimerase/dehydratase family protein n=1 Tax=Vibrio vulnificus TaxID=672 RepID=UPI001A2518B6|nr:NAD-dependent epimerase/dehydratase family protein [Vibrio vulnificus]MDS1828746.1 NAD-dependent epimerase/dehydratase family protein [Vibrio vulnificus]HAS8318996.1 NAD-dependent epimerase/dehydratase family protein [Vibrio vulnificus]
MSNLVAVTGANGFVGRHFVKEIGCLAKPISRSHLSHPNSVVVDKIDSDTDWSIALDGCRVVIHLAALAHNQSQDINLIEKVNVHGAVKIFEQAIEKGVKRFIYISTIGIHGTSSYSNPFKSNDVENPNGPYANSKLAAEKELKKMASGYDIDLVIIRPPLIYGKDAPGNFSSMVDFVRKSPFLPFGASRNRRDFISIYNFVDLLKYCLNAEDVKGKIILPSDNNTMTMSEFTTELALCMGKEIYQVPIPIFLFRWGAKLIGKEKIFLQLFGNLEIELASNDISWLPKYSVHDSLCFLKDSLK